MQETEKVSSLQSEHLSKRLAFGFVFFYEFLLDPARENNHTDGQIGVVGHSTPEQGDEGRCTQLEFRSDVDQIAAVGAEYVFSETAASGRRHDQHHDPHDQLPCE